MVGLPVLPPWEGLHPSVVHFPIALLTVAPIFILLGLLIPTLRRGLLMAAFVVMVLGVAGAVLAVATGESAGQLVDRSNETLEHVLEEHEEAAEMTRTVFAILTIIYAVLAALPWASQRLGKRTLPAQTWIGAMVVFVIVYGLCLLLLVNTGHLGGRLVHEFGVQAQIGGTTSNSEAASPDKAVKREHREH